MAQRATTCSVIHLSGVLMRMKGLGNNTAVSWQCSISRVDNGKLKTGHHNSIRVSLVPIETESSFVWELSVSMGITIAFVGTGTEH
jgi:hypothetical protein